MPSMTGLEKRKTDRGGPDMSTHPCIYKEFEKEGKERKRNKERNFQKKKMIEIMAYRRDRSEFRFLPPKRLLQGK